MIVRVKAPKTKDGDEQTGWVVDGVPSAHALFVMDGGRGTRALAEIVGEERAFTETQIEIDCSAKTFRQLKTQGFWR